MCANKSGKLCMVSAATVPAKIPEPAEYPKRKYRESQIGVRVLE